MQRIASRRRLSTKQLNKIPTKKFKKGDAYEVCAICLEDYQGTSFVWVIILGAVGLGKSSSEGN